MSVDKTRLRERVAEYIARMTRATVELQELNDVLMRRTETDENFRCLEYLGASCAAMEALRERSFEVAKTFDPQNGWSQWDDLVRDFDLCVSSSKMLVQGQGDQAELARTILGAAAGAQALRMFDERLSSGEPNAREPESQSEIALSGLHIQQPEDCK